MAIREVLRMGHPTLRQRARELSVEEVQSHEIRELIVDMVDTMHAENGVGLAAPQIGVPLRLAIIEFEADSERYPGMGEQGLIVFVNPKVEVLDSKPQGFWEGCLSVPGLRGYVERPRSVRVTYLDQDGKSQEIVTEGFLSTVFQHEFDHLDGKLYIDRISDPTQLSFVEEFEEFIAPQLESQGAIID